MMKWQSLLLSGLIGCQPLVANAAEPPPDSPAAKQEAQRLDQMQPVKPHGDRVHVDHSGRKEAGQASFYAKSFSNRKMADGRRMDPNASIAASKTLPLGSVATVTNLSNGKTATVKIEDRGPYVDGRIVDLAPKVANQLDVGKTGVVPVEVKPITVPQQDGSVKLGAGAATASTGEVKQATEMTRSLTEAPHEEAANR